MTVTGRFIIPEAESYTHFAGLLYDLLEDRCTDNANIAGILLFLLFRTNILQVVVFLCRHRSKKKSKCGENISDTHSCALRATF